LDENMLESAVMSPQASWGGQFLYDSLYKMTAALWRSLACNHAFQNGNKRVALMAASVFLRVNGYRLAFTEMAAFGITNGLVEHQLFPDNLATMIESNSAPLGG
jgi:death-on-curing protein